ncbi:TIGR03086 family metal-binding protein [Streptomyces sp. NPDC048172]|uniref:TIGR03086 family metal-binding protein n=1 Tax=Streptomyces sp. NPDC048172 TaxID=3365505 RepID=UPI0037197F2E
MDLSSLPDARPLYDRALAQLVGLVDAAKPEQFDAPTPCTEWTVHDLLVHLLDVAARSAAAGSGGEPAAADGGDDSDWHAALTEAAGRVREAWADDALLDQQMQMAFGEVPGRMAVAVVASDAIVHAWDLARALDLPTGVLDPELAAFAREIGGLIAPPERRGAPVPFDPVREASPDADAYTHLAAWMGRDPEWAAA